MESVKTIEPFTERKNQELVVSRKWDALADADCRDAIYPACASSATHR